MTDLPIPTMQRPEGWGVHAKCFKNPNEFDDKAEALEYYDQFFPPRDKAKYKPIADAAKGICKGKDGRPECPVRLHCLMDAIDSDEPHGIMGGMSHRERNALVRRAAKKGQTVREYLGVPERVHY